MWWGVKQLFQGGTLICKIWKKPDPWGSARAGTWAQGEVGVGQGREGAAVAGPREGRQLAAAPWKLMYASFVRGTDLRSRGTHVGVAGAMPPSLAQAVLAPDGWPGKSGGQAMGRGVKVLPIPPPCRGS